MTTKNRRARFWPWAAVAGVVSALVLLAVAELLALVFAPDASPLLAVGGFVIDIVPQGLKEFAIAVFGAADKIVLLVSLGIAAAIGAALAGILQYLRPPWGALLFAVAAVAATAAVLTRASAGALSFLPPIAGGAAGIATVAILVGYLRTWASATRDLAARAPDADGNAEADAPGTADTERLRDVNRRGFFRFATIAGLAAVVVGAGARVAQVVTSSIGAVREALTLPEPGSTVTIPEGAELDVPGISPLVTPNADFYRVDTALTVPEIDPATWTLKITGMVDEEVEVTFDELVEMGVDEYAITLTCVSNEVGGGLVGNAVWTGVPVRDLLARARPQGDADMVLSRSVDGYTASTPLASLTDDGLDAILAVSMNGEPLPLEHGFPVRMVVPGLYGYVSATKWLTELKVTTFAEDEAYWTPRGYSAEAPIKFSSRLDTPRSGQPVEPGEVALAGMAWAQTVGIERVEVSIDDGEWQSATLSTPINDDTWVQWMLPWQAEEGTHYVTVRAVNKAGDLQIEERAPIAPNGSSGWQRSLITVR